MTDDRKPEDNVVAFHNPVRDWALGWDLPRCRAELQGALRRMAGVRHLLKGLDPQPESAENKRLAVEAVGLLAENQKTIDAAEARIAELEGAS